MSPRLDAIDPATGLLHPVHSALASFVGAGAFGHETAYIAARVVSAILVGLFFVWLRSRSRK